LISADYNFFRPHFGKCWYFFVFFSHFCRNFYEEILDFWRFLDKFDPKSPCWREFLLDFFDIVRGYPTKKTKKREKNSKFRLDFKGEFWTINNIFFFYYWLTKKLFFMRKILKNIFFSEKIFRLLMAINFSAKNDKMVFRLAQRISIERVSAQKKRLTPVDQHCCFSQFLWRQKKSFLWKKLFVSFSPLE